MFGFIKKNKAGKRAGKRKEKTKDLPAGHEGDSKQKGSQGLTGDALRTQALANARTARGHIGEETIQKIAAAMAKKQHNPMEKAKAQLANVDSDRITDELLYMLDDK